MINAVSFSYGLLKDNLPDPDKYKGIYISLGLGLLFIGICLFILLGASLLLFILSIFCISIGILLLMFGVFGSFYYKDGVKGTLEIVDGKLIHYDGDYFNTIYLDQITRVRRDPNYFMFITKDRKEYYIYPRKILNKTKRKEFTDIINDLFPPIIQQYYKDL